MISVKNIIFIVFILMATLIAILSIKNYRAAEKKFHKWSFNGIVDDITYDDKGYPVIIVNSDDYDLGLSQYYFDHMIQKGDSIKKDSGQLTIKLIKKNNGKIIVFPMFSHK